MGAVKLAGKPSPRERLLAAADELFYAEGVQTVGIDRIIERASVAKATLYNAYGGKEQLIRAYLDARLDGTTARTNQVIERYSAPRERLLAVFDAQAELFAQSDFHGCAFAMAGAEAPSGGLIEQAVDEYRAWLLDLLTALAAEAGAPDPAALGVQLRLLHDGAGLTARMDRSVAAAIAARAAAAALLDAAVAVRAPVAAQQG
ncbi:TetR/AcrR family transcriptional regulator [Streptomyces sp. S1D4-11]|nr:TetR/AcrR family transcriptional regulator [Streptomyces sp. S1D4-11]QIZ01151.1 TetR/AcrR family transcriptional regulator [Streptomyces sp. S1D4-11]